MISIVATLIYIPTNVIIITFLPKRVLSSPKLPKHLLFDFLLAKGSLT